jgi:hypothetical protein
MIRIVADIGRAMLGSGTPPIGCELYVDEMAYAWPGTLLIRK